MTEGRKEGAGVEHMVLLEWEAWRKHNRGSLHSQQYAFLIHWKTERVEETDRVRNVRAWLVKCSNRNKPANNRVSKIRKKTQWERFHGPMSLALSLGPRFPTSLWIHQEERCGRDVRKGQRRLPGAYIIRICILSINARMACSWPSDFSLLETSTIPNVFNWNNLW